MINDLSSCLTWQQELESSRRKPLDPTLDWFLSHCHIRKYPERTTLVHAGERADTLYYVIHGKVVVMVKDDDGKEMILTYLGDNEFFGETGFFDKRSIRNAWVKTCCDTKIAEVSYRKFMQLININPQILLYLAGQLSHRLADTSKQASDLAFLDVTGRIAENLMRLAKMPDALTHPQGMQIRITRREIGQMVGCSRETVGRVLKLLENQHLITAHGKTIVVHGTR